MTTQPAPYLSDRVKVASELDYPSLVARLGSAFLDVVDCPARLVLDRGGGAALLVMAAGRRGGLALVKTVAVVPGEPLRSRAMVSDPAGRLVADGNGEEVTVRRTAAASVRAAAALARPEADRLSIVGAGVQAAAQAAAFLVCRRFQSVTVWARRRDRAEALARDLQRRAGPRVSVASSVGEAVRGGDIISVATRACAPLVRSEDVSPGAHVDLVGGFKPDMREADDALMRHAVVVADTPAALREAGDLVQPIACGALEAADVSLLRDWLVPGSPRRRARGDVTVYKSVGFAALDLVAAELLLERLGKPDA